MIQILAQVVTTVSSDPLTALFTRDWAALGGWGMFFSLSVLVVTGSFREWWVPGTRYKRMEDSARDLAEANKKLTDQNGDLITANQIVAHFFEETTPRRGSTPIKQREDQT